MAQEGWQCPVCSKVLAPWMASCPCEGKVLVSSDSTNQWSNIFPNSLVCLACHTTSPSPSLRHTCTDRYRSFC
jgi:hypothetical protein